LAGLREAERWVQKQGEKNGNQEPQGRGPG
jgi:hypothetical protein